MEWAGEGEVLVEEQRDGDETGAGILSDAGFEVAVGGLEDEGGERVVLGAEADGERPTDAIAVDDDGRGWDGACCGEIGEGGFGVGLHGGFGGVLAAAVAVAAVVEEKDVEMGVVEGARDGECVADGVVAVMQQEGGRGCGAGGGIAGGGVAGVVGGDEPAVELGLAAGIDAKVDFREVETKG